MEKIIPGTPDGTEENVERIAGLFPGVVTEVEDVEGNLERVVDFDALRDLLGDVAEGQRERYQFTCYIEGDNLDALKLLKETYAGQVKLIYIDPPYNTGHDFVYDDDYRQTHEEYDAESGDFDEDGGRLVANPDSNGRFHSDWCSMIYPRLVLARDMLSADGAIFISIDDNESANLRKICDEVFGAENFKSDISWQKRYTRSNNTVDFTSVIEHILVYAKSDGFVVNLLPRSEEADSNYSNPDKDPRGPWITASYVNPATKAQRPNLVYDIKAPDGRTVSHPTNAWKFSKQEYERHVAEHRLWWGLDGHAQYPRKKVYLSEARGLTPINYWSNDYAGNTDIGTAEVKDLFGEKYFDFPKPTILMRRILEHGSSSRSIVVDFFSGSASMADAVMQQNAIDGGTRRFIMVQLPEKTDEHSAAFRDGYKTICVIGEERIRRAGAKIKAEVEEANRQLKLGEEPKPVPDIGFRVLRIDSSNMEDTYRTPGETDQMDLLALADNVKLDRTPEDLLFEVLPKFRIPYSARIEKRDLGGRECFLVDGNRLVACFDTEVGTETIEEMAKLEPDYAVMRDASMRDDATHANFEELFKTYSPDTVRRVI